MALRYTINIQENKATMDLFVGGVFVTSYSYDAGDVTLATLVSPVTVPENELNENLSQIARWIKVIKTDIKPTEQKRAKFTEDIDKKNNKVQALFKHEGDIVTDAEYDPLTHDFVFQPRTSITMNFNCFVSWHQFLLRFYYTGINF